MAELIVVGAGPAGLSAALAARSLGVDVTLLEAGGHHRIRPGSRALFVHRQTLRLLDRMSPGTGQKIAGFGTRWRIARTCYRGREVHARDYGPAKDDRPAGGLPPYASLRQIDTERFLLDACVGAGVEPAWAARVDAVVTTPTGVTVHAEDGREWTADYLIGADGARSAVRAALAIAMDGERSTDYRVAVDVADDPEGTADTERVMHYRHPAMGDRNLLIVPFTGGLQVDVQCVGPDDSEELSDPEAVRRWLPRVVAPGYADRVLWISRYPCLQRIAAGFVDEHRRALLVGEAAHLFVPLGARGMNSAIADAEAAATAVAVALQAVHPERAAWAVEEYDRVRRQAAEHNRARVGQALRHLRADSRRTRTAQAAAARLAPLHPWFGAWLDSSPYGPRGALTLTSGLY
ncbi:FAD-dependent oxidoreductase [Streptomyces sp. NPDC055210]